MTVDVERIGRILVISIQREEKRNALNAEITAGVDAAMNELEDDPELWCGVLTGTATVFSAGADLGARDRWPDARGGEVGLVRRHRTKPLIAAVEGYAVGGGMELVLACDLVVASTAACVRSSRGEARAHARLRRAPSAACGSSRPTSPASCSLTGEFLPAERAERLGFVNRLTEPGRRARRRDRARRTGLRERATRGAIRARQRERGDRRGRRRLLGNE